jgi:hypothetical protein
MHAPSLVGATLFAAVLVGAGACADRPAPVEPDTEPVAAMSEAANLTAPFTDLVNRDLAGTQLTFWPYTGRTPTIGDAADPINLILVGDADPRTIRDRLMQLGGDRTAFGFPDAMPFNCTWTDAIGSPQAVWTEAHGWSGSVIQLECGDYETLRIHARLFRAGEITLVGVHFDLLIPGTTDHDVISWELPRVLMGLDLQRIGGSPVGVAAGITQAPAYRAVNPAVLPGIVANAPLYGLLRPHPSTGLPTSIDVDGNLQNDGNAPIFSIPAVAANGDGGAEISRQTIDIDFDQVIPRPFCDGDGQEFLEVVGPVRLTQKVMTTPSGNFVSQWSARGHLDVRQVAPIPTEWYRAKVNQHGRGLMTDPVERVDEIQLRMEIRPGGGDRGQLHLDISVGPNGAGAVSGSATCKG